ncbi:MAG: hypothetical protein O7H41_01445 [Planctomycetota bacterium]|nr:hypothetical protein [Planctomycetota bacterium]
MPRQSEELRLLTPKDAAKRLRTDIQGIENLILLGKLRGVAVSEKGKNPYRRLRLRVWEADVSRLVEKTTTQVEA